MSREYLTTYNSSSGMTEQRGRGRDRGQLLSSQRQSETVRDQRLQRGRSAPLPAPVGRLNKQAGAAGAGAGLIRRPACLCIMRDT